MTDRSVARRNALRGADGSSAGGGPIAPARVCAYTVVRRVFEQGAYTDRAFTAEASGLQARDRALAMQLAYGTVQRRATLDHIVGRLASRAPGELDPPILAALRLGLFQLLFLDGVAEHAAVNESVELAKREKGGGEGLVNAVLRRAVREGRALRAELDDRTPRSAAIMHSVPGWLAQLWWDELGAHDARALLARINEPAESALRVNTLASSSEDVLRRLPVAARPAEVFSVALGRQAAPVAPALAELPEGIVLEEPFDAHGSELWREGAIMPQSRGSMLVSRVLGPAPGERVLDLCAAPGAKTTHLAALMGDEELIVAVERHPGRADALARTVARMHVTCARVEPADAGAPRSDAFDRVLVDPPCSGLGTLQSRPDVRWRADPGQIAGLVALQARILAAAGAAVAPGGVLVYSVCTISTAESARLIDGFLREHPEFSPDDLGGIGGQGQGPHIQLLPHLDGTDGFFIARLRRR